MKARGRRKEEEEKPKNFKHLHLKRVIHLEDTINTPKFITHRLYTLRKKHCVKPKISGSDTNSDLFI